MAIMMGGKIDTGTAPNAANIVPNPTLTNIICTILLSGETDLMMVTILAMAPASCITVTCRIEVATTRAMGREAIIPERLAPNTICRGVLKNNQAIRAVNIQPAIPAISAGVFTIMSSSRMAKTGRRARRIAVNLVLLKKCGYKTRKKGSIFCQNLFSTYKYHQNLPTLDRKWV